MFEGWEWGILHSGVIEDFGLLGCDAAQLCGVRRIDVTWRLHLQGFNPVNSLTPDDHYSGRTAPLTCKRCILCIQQIQVLNI